MMSCSIHIKKWIAKSMLWNGCGALVTRTWKSRADKPKKL